MDARELRIGNWVSFEDLEIQVECLPIDYNYDNLQPIELTEDWLVKLGFEKYHPDKFTKGLMVITVYEHGCLYLANQRHVNFHYVHQLQNLYFALTGQELTLANEGRRDV